MRMWMVSPKLLCDKHLLGEHGEIHAIVGFINKGNTACIKGLINKGYIDTRYLYRRHRHLAIEMVRRGLNHKSPLPDCNTAALDKLCNGVSVQFSVRDLVLRCKTCAVSIATNKTRRK